MILWLWKMNWGDLLWLTYVAQLDKSLLSKSRCCLDPLQSWKHSSTHYHPKTKTVRMMLETKGLLAGQEPATSSRWEGEEQEDREIAAPNLQYFCCCIPSSHFLGPLYSILSSQELPSLGTCMFGLGRHRLGKIHTGIILFICNKTNW